MYNNKTYNKIYNKTYNIHIKCIIRIKLYITCNSATLQNFSNHTRGTVHYNGSLVLFLLLK